MKLIGASIPLPPSQALGYRRARRAADFGLAGQVRCGSDLREQADGGVQQVGHGDCAGSLVLEQSHQLVPGQCGQETPGAGRVGVGLHRDEGVGASQDLLQVAQFLLQALGEELLGKAGGRHAGLKPRICGQSIGRAPRSHRSPGPASAPGGVPCRPVRSGSGSGSGSGAHSTRCARRNR